MSQSKGKILVVSRDPELEDIRKTTLEAAGFTVITAMDERAVEQACSSNGIQLIMLGYSLAPSDTNAGRNHASIAMFPFWSCTSAAGRN